MRWPSTRDSLQAEQVARKGTPHARAAESRANGADARPSRDCGASHEKEEGSQL